MASASGTQQPDGGDPGRGPDESDVGPWEDTMEQYIDLSIAAFAAAIALHCVNRYWHVAMRRRVRRLDRIDWR